MLAWFGILNERPNTQAVMEYPYIPNQPDASVGGGISNKGKIKSEVPQNATLYSALVKCYPLHVLLDVLGVRTVHYFSLDVEGLELKILKTLPFGRIPFHVIQVEPMWNDEGKEPLKEFILSLGYNLVDKTNTDFIFANMTALQKMGRMKEK